MSYLERADIIRVLRQISKEGHKAKNSSVVLNQIDKLILDIDNSLPF